MLLSNERNTTFEDLHRYFAGCYVLDPNTGKPCRVIGINPSDGAVTVSVASPSRWSSHLSYYDHQAVPFYNLSSYTTPPLGWRRVGNRVGYLYRRAMSGGGVRGLNNDRILVMDTSSVRAADPVLAELMIERAHSGLCYSIFNPTRRTLATAIQNMASNGYSSAAVVNEDVCLLPYYTATLREAERYMIAFQRSVIGIGEGTDITLSSPQFEKYLGATDGTSVRSA